MTAMWWLRWLIPGWVIPGWLTLGTLVAGCQYGPGDERLVPLAASGDWTAVAHHTGANGPPDICVAVNASGQVAFRADAASLDLRVSDTTWLLPKAIGMISVEVGDWTDNFDVITNSATMVQALVPRSSLADMFAAMDKATKMTLTVGKITRVISLAGSTRATNAFRRCAGLGRAQPPRSGNPSGDPSGDPAG